MYYSYKVLHENLRPSIKRFDGTSYHIATVRVKCHKGRLGVDYFHPVPSEEEEELGRDLAVGRAQGLTKVVQTSP